MSNEEDNPASFTSVKPARRLAAILHADVHGYSRCIHDDEAGTLQVLTSALDPNSAENYSTLGNFLVWVGQLEEAIG